MLLSKNKLSYSSDGWNVKINLYDTLDYNNNSKLKLFFASTKTNNYCWKKCLVWFITTQQKVSGCKMLLLLKNLKLFTEVTQLNIFYCKKYLILQYAIFASIQNNIRHTIILLHFTSLM